MPQTISSVPVEGDSVDIVLTTHVLNYLNDPRTPSKTTNLTTVQAKAEESVPQAHTIYQKTRAYFTGVSVSGSTGLNLVFSFKKVGLRRYEFKVLTVEIKAAFDPASKKDVMIRVSKKLRTFKNQRAFEIGPDIYALPTSFEGADPYGLIQGPLVQGIMSRRKEFAPDFYGSLYLLDESIYCVASVDRGGSFFVDSAFWQPYGDFHTLRVE